MNSENFEFRIKSLLIVSKEIENLTLKMKKDNKSPKLVHCLYLKIFILLDSINRLLMKTESFEKLLLDSNLYSRILSEIYSELPYLKQRKFLNDYYFIDATIRKCR